MSTLLLESPPLLNLRESQVYRECPGFKDPCGTELDEDDLKFCKACEKEKEEAERVEALIADGNEPLVFYEYLTDTE